MPHPEQYANIIDHHLETDPFLPKIPDVVKDVSSASIRSVRVEGPFYVGDRAAESSNVVERDMQPDEIRAFVIRYFRGDEARRIDDHDVNVIEVYL